MLKVAFLNRLYVRISAVIGLIALLISGVASYVSYHASLVKGQQISSELVLQLAKSVTRTAAIAVYVNNEELADEITKGLASNSLVSAASLSRGTLLNVHNGQSENAGEPVTIELVDPFNGNRGMGILKVYPDSEFIKESAIFSARQSVSLLIGLSIIIAIIVSVVIYALLMRPIGNLIEGLNAVNLDSPDTMQIVNLNYSRKDELGRLMFCINSLITALKNTFIEERGLRQKTETLEKRFRLIFEQASAGIAVINNQNKVITHNNAFAKLVSFEPNNEPDIAGLFIDSSKFAATLKEVKEDNSKEQLYKDLAIMRDGELRFLHCLFSKIVDERLTIRDTGAESLIQLIMYDITDRTRNERKIRYEADHDPLTCLKNRRAGEKGLEDLCKQVLVDNASFILMMIDLDRFKPVNDNYGHEVGDEVLKIVAARIRHYFDEQSDVCVRWGGDEFIVGFHNKPLDKEEISALAQNVLSDLNMPYEIENGPTCHIGASIGIVIAPNDAQEFDNLIGKADSAMYYVKQNGRNQVCFYSDLI